MVRNPSFIQIFVHQSAASTVRPLEDDPVDMQFIGYGTDINLWGLQLKTFAPLTQDSTYPFFLKAALNLEEVFRCTIQGTVLWYRAYGSDFYQNGVLIHPATDVNSQEWMRMVEYFKPFNKPC